MIFKFLLEHNRKYKIIKFNKLISNFQTKNIFKYNQIYKNTLIINEKIKIKLIMRFISL
jgi:hypothetical protein